MGRALASSALVAAFFVAACNPMSSGRTPPFRERPYGAGLDSPPSGQKIEARGSGGVTDFKYRVTARGVVVFDGESTRLGRLAPVNEGWSVDRVDGSVACAASRADDETIAFVCGEVAVEVRHERDARVVISVAGAQRAVAAPSGERWELRYGDETRPAAWATESEVAVRTHPDAVRRAVVLPDGWSPAALATSRVRIDELSPVDAQLVGGAAAWWIWSRERAEP